MKRMFKEYEQVGGTPPLRLFHCGMPQADSKLSVLFRACMGMPRKDQFVAAH